MDFVNVFSEFIGVTLVGLLLTLYSTMHIDTIRYTLLDHDKKVEYSFKRLIINIVFAICLLAILILTTVIYKTEHITNKNSFYIVFAYGILFLIFACFIISKLFYQLHQIWNQDCKFYDKIKKICMREDMIFPLIAVWIFVYYAFLCFSLCVKISEIPAIILALGIIIFIPVLFYGMYKKSGNEQNISYYYAYEKNSENNSEDCCNKLYIYENIDGVLVCRYKDCLKVTEEKSNKLSKKLGECKEHIKNCVMDEDNKKNIIEKIDVVKKYNKHGYIELDDKCLKDFISKINGYNGTTPNDESILKGELEEYLMEIKEFTSIKLVDISSIKDGKIHPHLDNIEKFNNLM